MELTIRSNIKNRLVQYKGGGYDGCHWEWNYFLFDNKGKFRNLITSGRYGIGTLSEAIEILNENSAYVYKLNELGIKEFTTECNEMSVKYVSKLINDIYKYEIITMQCPVCENKSDPNEMHSTGYKGDGGIGIIELDYVCEDCYYSGSCGQCGEYSGDYNNADSDFLDSEKLINEMKMTQDEIKELNDFDQSTGPVCHYCCESHIETYRKNQNKGVKNESKN